jgi:hypothetical protein
MLLLTARKPWTLPLLLHVTLSASAPTWQTWLPTQTRCWSLQDQKTMSRHMVSHHGVVNKGQGSHSLCLGMRLRRLALMHKVLEYSYQLALRSCIGVRSLLWRLCCS